MTLYTANGHRVIRSLNYPTFRRDLPGICQLEEMRRADGFACYVIEDGREVADADHYVDQVTGDTVLVNED